MANWSNIYTFILILLLLLSAFAAVFKLRWLVVIAGLGLGLFAGLRGRCVGPDTITYYKHFISQSYSTSDIGGFEKGYSSIEYFFAQHGFSASTFIFMYALVSMVLLAIFLKKYADFAMLSLTYYFARYFLSRDMNQIRQALESIIVLYGFKYMREKRIIPFSVIVLLAMQFHTVAIVMFPVYFLYQIIRKIAVEKLAVMSLGYFVVMYVSANLFSPLLAAVSGILNRGDTYITDTSNLGQASTIVNLVMFNLVIVGLLLLYTRRFTDLGDTQQQFIIVYIIGTGFLLLLRNYPVLAARLSSTITTIEMLVFIYAIQAVNFTRNKALWLLATLMFVTIVYYLNVVTGNAVGGYLPYVTG